MRYRRCLILEEEKKAFRYDVLHISGNIFFLHKCATPITTYSIIFIINCQNHISHVSTLHLHSHWLIYLVNITVVFF